MNKTMKILLSTIIGCMIVIILLLGVLILKQNNISSDKSEQKVTEQKASKDDKKSIDDKKKPEKKEITTEAASKDPFTENDAFTKAYIRNQYMGVLTGVLAGRVWEDGSYINNYADDFEQNEFVIWDIDKDGEEELLFNYTTDSMACMRGVVYDYNPETKKVEASLSEFPDLQVYSNGVIRAGWSHNQGFGPRFWPYNMYVHNEKTDSYDLVGSVDSWEKEISDTDYEGNPFPTEADKDGDGIVYFVNEEGYSSYSSTAMDLSEYEKWENSYINGSNPETLPFEKLSYDNLDRYATNYISEFIAACNQTLDSSDYDIGISFLKLRTEGNVYRVENEIEDRLGITFMDDDETGLIKSTTKDEAKFTCYEEDSYYIEYADAPADHVKLLGIAPGDSKKEALSKLEHYGLLKADWSDPYTDNACYISGDGLSNFQISIDFENDKVIRIGICNHCSYVG